MDCVWRVGSEGGHACTGAFGVSVCGGARILPTCAFHGFERHGSGTRVKCGLRQTARLHPHRHASSALNWPPPPSIMGPAPSHAQGFVQVIDTVLVPWAMTGYP